MQRNTSNEMQDANVNSLVTNQRKRKNTSPALFINANSNTFGNESKAQKNTSNELALEQLLAFANHPEIVNRNLSKDATCKVTYTNVFGTSSEIISSQKAVVRFPSVKMLTDIKQMPSLTTEEKLETLANALDLPMQAYLLGAYKRDGNPFANDNGLSDTIRDYFLVEPMNILLKPSALQKYLIEKQSNTIPHIRNIQNRQGFSVLKLYIHASDSFNRKTDMQKVYTYALKSAACGANLDVQANERYDRDYWRPNYHDTLLSIAITHDHIDMVKLIIAHGDVNLAAGTNAPLVEAMERRNIPIIKLLLNSPKIKVNINAGNVGTTPILQEFIQEQVCKRYNGRDYLEVFQLLVGHPDIDVNRNNSAALKQTIYTCESATFKILIESGKVNLPRAEIENLITTKYQHRLKEDPYRKEEDLEKLNDMRDSLRNYEKEDKQQIIRKN